MERSGPSKDVARVILFPGALGDFLCLLPALVRARAARPGRWRLFARREWSALLCLDDTDVRSIDGREIAELFRPGDDFSAACVAAFGGAIAVDSWTGHGDPNLERRLRRLSAGPVRVHPFRGARAGEHAAAAFARAFGVDMDPASIDSVEVLRCLAPALVRDDAAAGELLARSGLAGARLLVVHPGSGSRAKTWPGFAAAVAAWRQAAGPDAGIVALRGPAEERWPRIAGAAVVANAALPVVAGLLARAAAYVGNDSGISHLAGVLGARGLVLFGPSDPRQWRPLGGGLRVVHRPDPCDACGDVLCLHRLSVADVVEELARLASASAEVS